jgi:hypothetical protein
MLSPALADLWQLLQPLASGSVNDESLQDRVVRLLAKSWSTLQGGDEEGMDADKLVGRVESLTWDTPELRFEIERHGGTVHGSTLASRQRWNVNLDRMTATPEPVGLRQVSPRAPNLDLKPLVEKAVNLILTRQDDPWLQWQGSDLGPMILGVPVTALME